MNLLRGASTAASGGLTNPILATIELVIAIVLSVLAVTAPLIGGIVVLGVLGVAIQRVWTFVARRRTLQHSPSEVVK